MINCLDLHVAVMTRYQQQQQQAVTIAVTTAARAGTEAAATAVFSIIGLGPEGNWASVFSKELFIGVEGWGGNKNDKALS